MKMKQLGFIFCLACFTFSSYSQPNPPYLRDTFRPATDSIFGILNTQQSKINLRIDSLRKDIGIIKTNTEPQTIFGKFIENAFLQKSYDFFFGGEEKPGLAPFIISILGLLVGVIRIIVIIIKFRKKKTENHKGILISILLVIISFLMFILSNRNFKSDEAIRLSNLEEKIDAIRRENQINKTLLIKDTSPNKNFSQVDLNIDKLTAELTEIKNNINQSQKTITDKIEDKSTNKFWIILNTFFLIFILILLKDKIEELFK